MKPRTGRCARCGRMKFLKQSAIKGIGRLCEPCAKALERGEPWRMEREARRAAGQP